MGSGNLDVVILTEAGDGRGYGHVARCYGLHEALVQAGRNVKLWVDCAEPVPDCVISGSAYQTFDWMDVLDSVLTADRASSVISVIDSYRVDRQLLDAIVSRSSSCFFFDDTGSRDYPNGTVINAAIHAESLYPRRPKGTRYLLGPSYAVLRKGFWSPRPYEVRSRVRRALVALGSGVDRKTARSVALSLEGCLAGAKVTVLHEAARSRPPGDGMERFDWAWDLPPSQFIELALGSDLAVCSGGQVLLELACLGVPAITIITAENQRPNVSGLERERVAVHAGGLEDPACLRRLESILCQYRASEDRSSRSTAGRKLVDGRGAFRVAEAVVRTGQSPEKEHE